MDLIQEVAYLTDLPAEEVSQELYQIAERQGVDIANMQMDDLRLVISELVQDVLVNLKKDLAV